MHQQKIEAGYQTKFLLKRNMQGHIVEKSNLKAENLNFNERSFRHYRYAKIKSAIVIFIRDNENDICKIHTVIKNLSK